jgi:hypothetical protein
MAVLYDDNFGYWRVDDPEELAFFKYVQSQSVQTSCDRCQGAVRLMARKLLCAPCISALECGAPLSMRDYGPSRRGTAGSEPVPARAGETRSRARSAKLRPSTVARVRRA